MNDVENLIPITFGITGHRDIHYDDQKRAADCVQNVIKSFRTRYPQSPFVFISPLADGADIIAAEAALSADPSGNCYLYVVLPYELEPYKKSISQAWYKRFEKLLDKRTSLKILKEYGHLSKQSQECAYEEVGEFVAIFSHVLFVMKNNEEASSGKGGTADIVRFRKEGCVNLRDITQSNLNHAEDGLVYEIRVRKSGENLPAPDHNDDKHYMTPWDLTLEEKEKNKLKKIAKERLGLGKGKRTFLKPIYKVIDYKKPTYAELEIELFNTVASKDNTLDEPIIESDNFLDRIRKISDTLSGQNQKIFTNHFSAIIGLALLATLLQTIQEIFHVFPEELALFIKLIPLGLAALLYLHAEFSKYKSKHESCRSLCEGLKVQAFWSRAQVPESAADHFLVGDFGPSSWVRRALRSCTLVDLMSSNTSKSGQNYYEELERLRVDWLADQRSEVIDGKEIKIKAQITWLADKITSLKERVERVEKRIKWCSAIWLVSYLFASVIDLPFMEEVNPIIGPYTKYIQFFGLFPLIAMAMYKHYVDGRGFGVTYKRYLPLHHFYVQANRLLIQILTNAMGQSKIETADQPIDPIELEAAKTDADKNLINLFRLVGIAALGEVSDWYIANSRVTIQNPVSKE